jgi:predicted RNA-binding Zn-ribbon protein involved in translation (DUF1610 family)
MGGQATMDIPDISFNQPMGYRTNPHIGHSHHLCAMAENGDVGLEQMKDLIRNPKFMCKRCGRAAQNSDNLCEPVSLDYSCGMCGASFSSKAKMMDHAKTHKD